MPDGGHRLLASVPSALRNVVVLVVLTAAAGAAIAWFAGISEAAAERNRGAAETRELRALLARHLAAPVFEPLAAGDGLRFCDEGVVVVQGSAAGYGGPIRVALALRAASNTGPADAAADIPAPAWEPPAVVEVVVLAHSETPGFADILDTGSDWLGAFPGAEADAVTGATVTSQAVLASVERMLERVEREGWCGEENAARDADHAARTETAVGFD